MRILVVIDSFYTGGAEYSTLELLRFLKGKKIPFAVCKLKEMSPEYNPEFFEIEKELIHTLPKGGFIEKRKALKKIINDFKPTIVHSVLFKANLLVRSIRILNSSFVHIESLVNHTYSKNRLNEAGVTMFKLAFYRWLDLITALLGTNHFHANGVSVAKHYMEKLFISEKKMTVVHRGRNSQDYNVTTMSKIDLGIDEKKIVLINVGRQEFQKGQDVLIESISLLSTELKNKITLLIVGREGKVSPVLNKMIKDKDLDKIVLFLGHRNDIPHLLNMSDIFVFPSRFEGLPGVLIEAEASGLPIICTHLSMMLEVVSVNNNAITFELDNPQDLSNAIEKMVLNESMRNEFSKSSLQLFKNNFQIETVHQKMLEMYINISQ